MSVGRMAIETTSAHINRTESLESTVFVGVGITFKYTFALEEIIHHSCILNSRGSSLVSICTLVEHSSELTSGIIFFTQHFRIVRRTATIIVLTVGTSHSKHTGS